MVHYLAVATIAASTFAVTPTTVQWQGDYGKALATTRSDQRPLLVVLDAPSDPATAVQADVLAAEGPNADLLKSYELCRVDVTTEYGKKVAAAFGATQFPHTSIIDKNGATVLFKKPGQISGDELKTALAKFEKGEQPTAHNVGYRGNTILGSQATGASYPAGCTACQRKAMGL
jgi:hypothetical protein